MRYMRNNPYLSSSLSKKEDLFRTLHSFLVATGKLDTTDASIYVLALNKGVINSSDVSDEFPNIRSNTAIARLKTLAKKGFLESVSRETSSRRPYAVTFKAVHPRIALKEVLQKTLELPGLLSQYDEHWEILAENPRQDTEVWLSKSEKVATSIGASILSGAKQEVKIYAHDCSWFNNFDIQQSLADARSNGATVSVVAHNPGKDIAISLVDLKVALYKCEECFGPPFCIVDKNWLFLPVQSGTLSKQFSALRTNDQYLINNFLSLFETALGCSTLWGKKDV
jgi:hypothetical protein